MPKGGILKESSRRRSPPEPSQTPPPLLWAGRSSKIGPPAEKGGGGFDKNIFGTVHLLFLSTPPPLCAGRAETRGGGLTRFGPGRAGPGWAGRAGPGLQRPNFRRRAPRGGNDQNSNSFPMIFLRKIRFFAAALRAAGWKHQVLKHFAIRNQILRHRAPRGGND